MKKKLQTIMDSALSSYLLDADEFRFQCVMYMARLYSCALLVDRLPLQFRIIFGTASLLNLKVLGDIILYVISQLLLCFLIHFPVGILFVMVNNKYNSLLQ